MESKKNECAGYINKVSYNTINTDKKKTCIPSSEVQNNVG